MSFLEGGRTGAAATGEPGPVSPRRTRRQKQTKRGQADRDTGASFVENAAPGDAGGCVAVAGQAGQSTRCMVALLPRSGQGETRLTLASLDELLQWLDNWPERSPIVSLRRARHVHRTR